MKSVDLVASGYLSFDRIVRIDRPAQVGQTSIVLNADSPDVHFGGCSVNVCALLGKLKQTTRPIVRVGEDAKEQGFFEYLADHHVLTDAITTIKNTRSSHAYLIEDPEGEHITLYHPGAMDGRFARPPQETWFKRTRLAAITVGAPEDNLQVLAAIKRHNIPLVFGMRIDEAAFPEPVLRAILAETVYLFMNQAETAAVCALYEVPTVQELFKQGRFKIIVTTKGAEGSTVYVKTGVQVDVLNIKAVPPACLVDPAGAGDAYIAGFILGLLEARSPRHCGELGATLASFILEATGCTTAAPEKAVLLARHDEHFGGKP